jgi:sulfur dioxygenase
MPSFIIMLIDDSRSVLLTVNTHVHADHITGTGMLKKLTGCKSMISKDSGAVADSLLSDGENINFGDQVSVTHFN